MVVEIRIEQMPMAKAEKISCQPQHLVWVKCEFPERQMVMERTDYGHIVYHIQTRQKTLLIMANIIFKSLLWHEDT